jgi:hypothetical protein
MQPRHRDYSFAIAFLSSLLINSGMIGMVVVHARPSQEVDLAQLHPPHLTSPTTAPSGPEYLPDDDSQDTPPEPTKALPKPAPPPPPPPKVQMDNREAFGETGGKGEALNSSPGNQPMQAIQGPQIQAFLGRNPSDANHHEGKPMPAGGGGENGGDGQPMVGAKAPAQPSAPRPPSHQPTQSPPRQAPAKQIPVQRPSATSTPPAQQPTPSRPQPQPQTPPKQVPAKPTPSPIKPSPAPNPSQTPPQPQTPPAKSSKLDGKGTSVTSSPPPDGIGIEPARPAAVPAPKPKPPPSPPPAAAANDQSSDPLLRQPISQPQALAPPPADASEDLNSPPQDSTERLLALASQSPSLSEANSSPPGKPGAPGPPASGASVKNPAPQSDRDSDPFSTQNSIAFVNGKVLARNGRWVKTVKPNLTEAGYIDAALLANPAVTFLATVDEQGNVIRVILYHSSGSDNIDLPCEEALNDWKIEPSKDKNGKPVKDIVAVTFGLPH